MGDYGAPTLKPTVPPGSMEMILNALAIYITMWVLLVWGEFQPIIYPLNTSTSYKLSFTLGWLSDMVHCGLGTDVWLFSPRLHGTIDKLWTLHRPLDVALLKACLRRTHWVRWALGMGMGQ